MRVCGVLCTVLCVKLILDFLIIKYFRSVGIQAILAIGR